MRFDDQNEDVSANETPNWFHQDLRVVGDTGRARPRARRRRDHGREVRHGVGLKEKLTPSENPFH
jgi:hypothetical protein